MFKILLDSVKEPALHVSLIWRGVAKLFIKFHIFRCTFQCYFVALQFFAEESQCWYQPTKQNTIFKHSLLIQMRWKTIRYSLIMQNDFETHSFPSCFPLHTSLTTTSSTRPLCQDKKMYYITCSMNICSMKIQI